MEATGSREREKGGDKILQINLEEEHRGRKSDEWKAKGWRDDRLESEPCLVSDHARFSGSKADLESPNPLNTKIVLTNCLIFPFSFERKYYIVCVYI